jgi:crossover junction endodeoxyribonuclease RusA
MKTAKDSSSGTPNSESDSRSPSPRRTSSVARSPRGGLGAKGPDLSSGSSTRGATPIALRRSGVWATTDGLEIGVVLPLPARNLSPNSRVCWQAKARSVKAYRLFSFSLAQRYPRRWKSAEAEATFYFADRRRRDRDNLLASLKAAFDGIAAAGVVEDDADLTHLPVRIEVDRENPRVEIVLRRTE